MSKYLIIGNGIAGLSAAKEIRKNDLDGTITIVTSEPYLTYYRIKLTAVLATNYNSKDLLVYKQSWYDENKIRVLLSKIVERIDIEDNSISLDDGSLVKYEKLLIATGSRPFIPPINGKYKEGVFAIRTLKDLEQAKSYIEKKCETVTVIGGGLLGLEAAWALKLLGKKVKVIEFASHLLNKQLDKELGEKLRDKLVNEGIQVYLPILAEEILGETKVNGIRLNNGEIIETDCVLISSGIRPNLDLMRNTQIIFDKGIKVDNHLKTNIDNIYAAGDVVEVDNMILGLWTTSNEQGKIAGSNMSGIALEYRNPKLFTTLQLGNIQVFSVGNITDYDKVYEYKEKENDIHHKLFVLENKIIGAILFGDLKEIGKLKNAVFSNTDIEEYLTKGISFK